jgi:hypothetical protein
MERSSKSSSRPDFERPSKNLRSFWLCLGWDHEEPKDRKLIHEKMTLVLWKLKCCIRVVWTLEPESLGVTIWE